MTTILATAHTDASREAELLAMQTRLSDFFMRTPPELRFETATFQAYAAKDLGGAFVLLHVSGTSGK